MTAKLMATALILALLSCAVLAYLCIDCSISLDYSRQSSSVEIAATRKLERLLEASWVGMPERTVFERLSAEAARHPGENIVVKQEVGLIWFDEIQFRFEQGKLSGVGAR